MKIFESFPFKRDKKQNIETSIRKDFSVWLADVYDSNLAFVEKLDFVLSKLHLFFKYLPSEIMSPEIILDMETKIRNCFSFSVLTKKDFVKQMLSVLEPIIVVARDYPKEFEETTAHAINEEHGFIELNRLVSYQKNHNIIELHHSSAYTVGPKLKLYIQAMKDLAEIIKNDEDILEIQATSWIVYKAPKLFTKYGFTVETFPVGNKSINSFFSDYKPVAKASISRRDFLEKFGQINIKDDKSFGVDE